VGGQHKYPAEAPLFCPVDKVAHDPAAQPLVGVAVPDDLASLGYSLG
jgi:hypothetical protein